MTTPHGTSETESGSWMISRNRADALPDQLAGRIILLLQEVDSKPQLWFKSKATAGEKAQHTLRYVSISRKPATQLLGLR
jgi:hypothetical protein